MTVVQQTGRRLVVAPAMAPLINEFEASEATRISPKTANKYARNMRLFAVWLGNDATLAEVTTQAIGLYQQHLHKQKLARSSVVQQLTSIKMFNRWCVRNQLRSDNPSDVVVYPRLARNLPRPLTRGELDTLQRILADVPERANWGEYRRHVRNALAIRLLLYTGLRITEASELRWHHVRLDEVCPYILVHLGKGQKDRLVPIHPRLLAEFQAIPAHYRKSKCAVIYSVQQHADPGTPITNKSVAHIFERWLPRRGLCITAHQLRHTFATLLVQSGVSIGDIATVLGHDDPRTTMQYTAFSTEQLTMAVSKVPNLW